MQKLGAKFMRLERLQFWKGRMVVSSTRTQQTPDAPASSTGVLYQSAKECPLSAMIEVICGDNYNALGEAPTEALHEAWQNIYCEFCDLSGGAQIGHIVTQAKNSGILASKIERIGIMLGLASQGRNEAICAEFKADGYRLDFGSSDADYDRQLLVIRARLKADEVRLEQMQQPATQGRKELTEEDFERDLFEIGKFQGYAAKRADYTVYTYAVALGKLRAYAEAITPKAKQDGRR